MNVWFGIAAIALLGSCTSSKNAETNKSPVQASSGVSITTFATDVAERNYLDATKVDARFEFKDGCLYVGDDQVVWFYGTTVRPKQGAAQYEIFDAENRKLAETGTTVTWGGGEVSAQEAASTKFADQLTVDARCAQQSDNFWLIGKIQTPRFESAN